MKSFTQIWSDEAEDQLADLWIDAPDRADITFAQFQLEKALDADPYKNGKEVSEGLWRIDFPPLKTFYEINEQDRIVRVIGVGRLGKIKP